MIRWPKCQSCGGPLRPNWPSAICTFFDVETRSEANRRDRWGIIRRATKAQAATMRALRSTIASGASLPTGPWYVRLTRVSNDELDDDNLGRALKAVQDAVAAIIGVDDGSRGGIQWDRDQARGSPLGVIVEVWGVRA